MAIARPQPGGGSSGMKAALIAFVALAVGSLVFTIVLFTQQSDVKSAADQAQQQAQRSEQSKREALTDLQDVAKIVAGETGEAEADKIVQQVRTVVNTIAQDPRLTDANLPADAALLNTLQDVYKLLGAKLDELEALRSQHGDLEKQLSDLTASANETQQKLKTTVDELTEKFAAREKETGEQRQAWENQVAELRQQLTDAAEAARGDLSKERQQVEALEKELADQKARSESLVEQLASFKLPTKPLAGLQSGDGTVLKVNAAEGVVYIGLGREDGVRSGMPFSVYSRSGGIPDDGKGKAGIEVVNVFESTSECRVTQRERGEPILEGDLVANPVFDPSRKFTFAVAGDFDLDFDGRIEDAGGQDVARLIRAWGGQVVERVDTRTDFLVLGAAPPMPVEGAGGEDVDETTKTLNADRRAARDGFDGMLREAQALSIPILTRTQFTQFIGRSVPRGTEDQRPRL